MVARDDSVIRGSLIACMIFLVLSIALNFFLWRWGDTQATESAGAADRLRTIQTQVAQMENQAQRMRAMLGVGGFTQAEIDEMRQNAASDPQMQAIEEQFSRDMSYFGPEVEPQNRNYPALPEYLVNAIRSRNEQYGMARDEATKIRTDADNDIQNARTQQQMAEQQRDDANKKVVTLSTQFDEDRTRMNKEKEDTRDKLTSTVQDFDKFRRTARDESSKLTQKTRQMQGTIDTQKTQLNELRNDKFETTQGEVRYVVAGGNIVTINLGSADELRPGVTFGVIDGDETRLQDAKVKATVQVTQVQGPHLAQARVVATPEIRDPIIPGDKIYSPFWAPGREVKIALAGDIDIDGDKTPDNEAIKGQILAAGAVVAAEISSSGAVTGQLDPSIRFLVVGEDPEVSDDPNDADGTAQAAATLGNVKARAAELGLTILPVWKLQNYLKTIDDSLTTPLGSAARGEDFPPETAIGKFRLPNDRADLYELEDARAQKGNRVLSP
jgi:enamine deaminase RidA (YjgF/YER057c/UK114 family)